MAPLSFRAAVVTVSDSAASGEREDKSGPLAQEILEDAGIKVIESSVVADEMDAISSVLRNLCDLDDLDLVITTGGTGFGPRDVTPEATEAVIERQAMSLAEYMRFKSYAHGPQAALSRGIAGIRNGKLIVNLPGSPKGVKENLEALIPIIEHALDIVSGGQPH